MDARAPGVRAPLSFAQQRLWFLEQLDDLGSAYHLSRSIRLRGALDVDALARALDGVVARHDALRTTFHEIDGAPEQRIVPAGAVACTLAVLDLAGHTDAETELRRAVAAEVGAPFDLERGPLLRGVLFRLAPDDHLLLLTLHHIVSDGWSLRVLAEDLAALYEGCLRGDADPLPPLPVPYAEYLARQREGRTSDLVHAKKEYWRTVLAGAPPLLDLPTDHPRPARQQFDGDSVPVELDEALTGRLKALGERHGTTLFRTLLAAWAVVAGRLSGQDDVVVGVPMANRDPGDADRLIGFFVDTVVVRIDLSGNPTVGDLLERVARRTREARQHQDVPFEDVVSAVAPARSLAYHPIYQTALSWHNVAQARLSLPGLRPAVLEEPPLQSVALDTSLVLHEEDGRIAGRLEYARALFERATAERFVGYLRRVLEGMAADDGRPVDRLALMPERERVRVVEEWNRAEAAYPAESCLHELFEARVERMPDAAALVCEGEHLTYAGLNAAANRLARRLRAAGVGPEGRVGVMLERSTELVVGVLAVLKAGGVYLPLDPALPAARRAALLADAGAVVLVTRDPALDGFTGSIVSPADAVGEDGSDLGVHVPPAALAYVIYTSGSTGTPKGVGVAHAQAAAHCRAAASVYGLTPLDRVLQFAAAGFDVSLEQMLAPLSAGACVVLRGNEIPTPLELARQVAAQRLTVINPPTAYWHQLVADAAAVELIARSVRLVIAGGEAMSPAATREWGAGPTAGVRLLNGYGPTETVVTCTAYDVPPALPEGAVHVPVGRPLPGRTAYVVDGRMRPMPVGVPGELCVGGVLARGYLRRPAVTAVAFVPDPFSPVPGARMYRTGDRVRWSAAGNLEFMGRTDFQVKIRGYRIELGEIEARLAEQPGVREAVVLAREDRPGEKRLVAYMVGEEAAPADVLRARLGETLPAYMVPAAYVRLDALPLTSNGKLDRKALPAPEGDAFAARGYEAPVGEVESTVAAIWAELVGAERVGRRDHFFELGGHSLLAVRVVSRVRQALGVEAVPGDLFERPVLADFARGLTSAAQAEATAIVPVDRNGAIPLSFAQQRLWFLEQLGGIGATYHIPTRLRLRGELDRGALARALDRIVARHEALRTTFPAVDGEPVQRIASIEESAFRLVEHDLPASPDAEDELRRLMSEEATAPFDLAAGPLVRGRLVRMAADEHVLLLTMHHIVSDGWSAGVLHRELGALYGAFVRGEADPLPPLSIQYADYAAWHRRWAEGAVLEAQADYWTRTLSGAPELLALPADHPRPSRQDFAGAVFDISFDETLTTSLKALSQRHGTTLYMTLFAGWATVLGRLSGQDDVVIGTPSANRERAEVEELIGFFVNTLPVRVDLSDGPRVGDLLARVKTRTLEAQRNQDIPFDQVVERVRPARSLAYTPLFQVMLAWQNAGEGALELPGLTVDVGGMSDLATAKFDLSLALWEESGRIAGAVEYATSLFERETVERFVEYLRRVLAGMAADDSARVDGIPMLPAAERAQVLEVWNRTEAAYPAETCIHELFERQVERTPDAVALVHEGEQITYAGLNRDANRLAHHLRSLGVGPDVPVALCLERSPALVAGLLAVFKAGGAYVPLDPAYPDDRLHFMLADSAPAVLLTQASLAGRFAGVDVRHVALDADAASWAGAPETNPARGALAARSLAYVIYTSGSTGRPKGVMVSHGNLANLVAWHCEAFGLQAGHRSSSVAGVGFDAAAWEIWPPLSVGATLVLAGDGRDPGALLEWWASQPLDVSFLPTPLAESAFARGITHTHLRTLLVGGDRLHAAPSAPPSFALVNNYGPTETTVVATSGAVGREGRPDIGRPIANTTVYVLDRTGEPVPAGVVGELYIGGAGVARGYLGRPSLTAERFVPDAFGGEAGARMYRTGDLGRWLADGTLDFVGRNDHQVKVRGFRIELGEIETQLREHPALREAVVVVRGSDGEQRLVAYFAGDPVDAEALRAHLAARLPEHMVPVAYVRLDALPLTPNGKVDRRALPAPGDEAFARRDFEAPVGEVESTVAAIWAELLGAEQIGRHDDFFHLGGHSLLAVRVISRISQALGVEVSPRDVFERPVLADFARGLETAAHADMTPIERVDRTGVIPLSFAQQRLWFLEQLGGIGSAYHIPTRLRLRGELDRTALVRALDRIVARHEALRTTFPAVDGAPVQRIASIEESAFRLVEHDLSDAPDAEDALRRLMSEEATAPFDLASGPLVRGRLVRMATDDHVLLLTMHHIVSDGWSAGVMHRELGALYGAFVRGEADPLPPLSIQYADYAAWHRRWAEGAVLESQADYWTRTLAGAPELLELPVDHPRPARQEFAGAAVDVQVDEALTTALRTLGQRHGATLYMTLLAAWATVLARLSGQDDVVVGTPSANRGRAEVEQLIGFFINTLPIRIDLSDGPRVGELLARVKARTLDAQRNQDIPFDQVVERVRPARSLAYTPLFQVMFAWQNAPGGELELPGLRVGAAGVAETGTARFDLSLSLWEEDGRIGGGLTYARSLFTRETAERYAGYFRRVLEAMAADADGRMDRIALLPPAERDPVVRAWNDTAADFSRGACLPELFEARAARTPDADALVFGDASLSFAALNARANRLAHFLAARGVGPDVRVALCAERGIDAIVGLLAALKAGGAYVPLDPSYPVERLREMLADSRPVVLLTQASLMHRVGALGVPAVALDGDADAWAELPETNPARAALTPEHLAYVIYTSGSTGRPKGVMVRHDSVVNLAAALRTRIYAAHPTPLRVGVNAPLVFDGSVKQVIQLLAGHALCLVPDAIRRDPVALVAWLRRERVDALDMTPSLLRLALAEGLGDGGFPRFVLVGGEAVDEELRERMSRVPTRFYNVYGPTECTVDVTAREIVASGPAAAIGGPLPNVATYVLDPGGLPVPVGVAGELYVGGAGVARGYLDRPALTAERFVPDAFGGQAGARLYRTGDRVRWLADGTLEYLGRLDVQVKVRGFRIELGEIEARLTEQPGVRDAVVLAREDAPGEKRLVAYVTGDAPDAEALRAHLAARLPEYMVPVAYVRLDALPLTPNGKLDRRALPAPEGAAFAARGYEAPVGEVESTVAAIWAELVGAERVGRRDDFFHLGGHSLLAVRVVSRVRQTLGVEVVPGDLFERPVLADFARGLTSAEHAEATAIDRVDRTDAIPLSFAQQRLWFLEQLGGIGAAYHIPSRLRLCGALDRGALVRALDRIVARHEALRTTFPAADGSPLQRIASIEESAFRLVEHDLSDAADADDALRRLMSEEATAPFDLATGPLVRGRLVRMAADEHVLLLTMHHIVSDGWSAGVLHRELGALYGAFVRGEADPLPPLSIQYADYAAWHRRWAEGAVLESQADYWTRTLSGAPELLELPADHPRPSRQDFAGAVFDLSFDETLTAALKSLSQRHGTTLYMTLLAGWATVLGRLSGQDDVVIGTPSANRDRAEVEALIGFFVNTLPVRIDLSDGPRVGDLLARVKARTLEAQRNQDIPFDQVVERVRPTRSLAYTPLFQVMLAWQNAGEGALELPGLRVGGAGISDLATAKFDLSLALWEEDGRIAGAVEYATALFERETVERFVEYLRRVLAGMAADDSARVDGIPMLPAAERAQVLEAWNRTEAAYPSDQCIHELFERQVERTPDALALVHEGESLTYAELDARADRLAHRLAAGGVGLGVAVGVCLEWRPELVVALLATLKAGGVYVPLDPSLPSSRLAYIVDDAGIRALVTRAGLADRVSSTTAVRVDVDAREGSAALADAPRSGVSPADLAYVIYTSGSTGKPKGVAVEHGAAAAHLVAVSRIHEIVPEDRVLQFASAGFDVSLEQVFFPLLTGATLVLRGAELWSAAEFRARVRALGVTVANLPPAYWQAVADGADDDALAGVRLLLIGGDALPATAADPRGAGRLVNCYGPTEAVVTATAFAVDGSATSGIVPIGRPLPGRAAYVLDARGAPVPVGVAGELHIGGGLLARGYLGRPALTAERFVPDPFSPEPGARMYRTGDRVRWTAAGTLDFLGRTDFQVKIRGFRIELGEIEARLILHPAVRQAVVLAREDAPGEKRLVAYVAGEAPDGEALRAHLSDGLPEYMIPAAYVRLDALPLTANGKVDRKALPAPEGDAFAARGYEAPVGEVESTVAAIWAELLRAERVGRHDHFFELGGHSLLAVRVVSRVRHALGVEASPRDVFERPVLADFARGLETAAQAEATAIERVDRTGAIPLSFAQQRLWFLEQLDGAGAAYHVPLRLRLHGALDRVALGRALDAIVARHEALRTTFPAADGEPVQRIASIEESAFRLVEHDVHAATDAEDALRRLMSEEASAPFDLARGPLVRGRLIRMAPDDHVVLITMHHIVSDGWSMGVLVRELGALYDAFRRGADDPLPPLPIQYADYAAWQRRRVEGERLAAQADYWTTSLAGAPELLELPADRPRPARQDFAGATLGVELDAELTAALKALSQRHGATLFMTLLAGWAVVLGRLSGQADVVVGTPTANRDRREIEELIGFFVNTLALRVDLADGPTVAELLGQVRARALEAQQHQDIPFEQIVERLRPVRSLSHTPLFQVMFAWQNVAGDGPSLSGLRPGALPDPAQETAKFDLSLILVERGDRIVGGLNYATSLFEGATVERFVGYLRRVLEGMVADDGQRVEHLSLLPSDERARVVDAWNRTDAAYPSTSCIHQLFEAQVERTADAPAVAFEGRHVTYAELNARANRLAHHLRALGVGPDVRVGICAERTPAMVVGLLAVLKAGGAYVPLDPNYPEQRLRWMIEDSAPAVLLAGRRLADRFDWIDVPVEVLDAEAPAWASRPATNPSAGGSLADGSTADGVTSEHLAYVIFTSGSTGRPKGVAIAHRNTVNLLAWARSAFADDEIERTLFSTSLNFDLAVFELFVPLTRGATACLVEDAVALLQSPIDVTLINTVPSAMRALLDGGGLPASVRTVNLAGEPLKESLAERIFAETSVERLCNLYGPSETTTYSTGVAMPRRDGFVPHIGTPLLNTRTYILDASLEPVPVGVAGELHIGGAGVARGYLGRPDQTADRFVADPFGEPGARLYRTGDLARWRPDGTIEYLGRTDHQVKVRGFRIELGEIEARLVEHAAVREAVVLAREDAPGEKRLVAYVVAPEDVGAEVLRSHLSERLPEYMVPAAYVRLDALPLTPNGKLDRKALPAPADDAFARRDYEAPLGETEQALAGIWAEVLRIDRVGRWDDFFELGGHSLLAARVASRAGARFETHVSATVVFTHPQLADQARAVDEARASRVPASADVLAGGVAPGDADSVDMLSDDEVETLLAELLSKQSGA